MEKLRLVFENEKGEREDITLPMEAWIADWWYECDIVPSNDTAILIAELGGKPILNEIDGVDGCVCFEEVAWHYNWDGLHDDFIGEINRNSSLKNNSTDFSKWLVENMVSR